MFKKDKKEPYIPKAGIMGDSVDYTVYEMTVKDKIFTFLIGFAAAAVTGYVFYESVILSLLVGGLMGVFYIPIKRKRLIEKRKNRMLMQFKDMLESLNTSIGAGANMTDAFAAAWKDMDYQHSADSIVVKELTTINQGINNNIGIERLLLDWGDRSGLEDINSFANVFETCFRKGGNIKEVIKNTFQIITDKIDINQEIKTMVASQTNEQNIMMVMPVVFVCLLKTLGSEVINLSSPTGRISTTIAAFLFITAYFIGKKILSIKI